MKIVSYRGPGSAGGLSAAVGQAWREYVNTVDSWCHIQKDGLQILSHSQQQQPAVPLPQGLIGGHYQYCNEFLWPLMHDLEEHATYVPEHNRHYEQLNSIIGRTVSASSADSNYFIHDYHFALLPRLLPQSKQARSAIFWHIPWPEAVTNWSYIMPLADIARGMLGANVIGFHTQEYATRFMRFVEYNLPRFVCDWERMLIKSSQYGSGQESKDFRAQQITEIVVAPLGIDFTYWSSLANQNDNSAPVPLFDRPYILSVDRVDYTKGVHKRLQAIDCFFERFPQWQQKVIFVQACGRTRPGIAAFDNYWHQCQQLGTRIEEKWSRPEWSPLVWLQSALSTKQLAPIYRQAEVMLVNPIKDGLNLTAKEYIACQGNKPGVLALSPGAGVWQELGHYCLPVHPEEPEQMAQAINKALSLGDSEKMLRMSLLSDKVQANNLADWWYSMTNKLAVKTEKEVAPLIKGAY